MKKLTKRQRAVLELITPERPLCYGTGTGDGGHWFFSGGQHDNIFLHTGMSLRDSGYIVARPRSGPDQPFWLTKYDITEKGKAALKVPADGAALVSLPPLDDKPPLSHRGDR